MQRHRAADVRTLPALADAGDKLHGATMHLERDHRVPGAGAGGAAGFRSGMAQSRIDDPTAGCLGPTSDLANLRLQLDRRIEQGRAEEEPRDQRVVHRKPFVALRSQLASRRRDRLDLGSDEAVTRVARMCATVFVHRTNHQPTALRFSPTLVVPTPWAGQIVVMQCLRQGLRPTATSIGAGLALGWGNMLPAQEPTEPFAQAKAALAAIAYPVPDQVTAVERTPAEAKADLDAQQDLLMPPSTYPIQHALRRALGLAAGSDPNALRQRTVAATARGLAAYYDPTQQRFAVLPSLAGQMAKQMGGSLPLFTHELVHGHQDQREGGITGFFAAATSTYDEVLARRCSLEGEAELVAIAALAGEAAVPARMEAANLVAGLDKILSGETTGLIYAAGRKLALQQFQSGGLDAVRELWNKPPSSTEQALHPAKLGLDLPVPTTLPPLPGAEDRISTTIGELAIYSLLRELGNDVRTAGLASIGWDGDQIAVLRDSDGEATAVVWRSVWDRTSDATEFVAAMQKKPRGILRQHERMVDWVHSNREELTEQLMAALAKDTAQPEPGPDDAKTTAAAEELFLQEVATDFADGEHWHHPRLGLRIPIPTGWQLRELQGQRFLFEPQMGKEGFTSNINVQVLPGDFGGVQPLLEATRSQLESMPGLTVDKLEIGSLDGKEVLRSQFHGMLGAKIPLQVTQVTFVHEARQIIVTVTVPVSRWKDLEEVAQRCLDGARLTAK